jgi:hypothetical protein
MVGTPIAGRDRDGVQAALPLEWMRVPGSRRALCCVGAGAGADGSLALLASGPIRRHSQRSLHAKRPTILFFFLTCPWGNDTLHFQVGQITRTCGHHFLAVQQTVYFPGATVLAFLSFVPASKGRR